MAEPEKAKLHKYDYIFAENDGSAAAAIVAMVKNKGRVLEIGAGPGSIARVLKDKLGCNLTAIELDPNSVEKLKSFCDEVYCLDLNDANWVSAFDDIEKFDTIIAADVLEHLVEPLATLKLTKTLLSRNGQIIVSLPHVGHAALTACLFNSDFSYQENGLLDRTHLRFFGITNIQNLFDDADMCVDDVEFIVKPPGSTELAGQWHKLKPNVQNALLTSKYSNVYQVVIKSSNNISPGESIRLEALAPPKAPASLAQTLIPNYRLRRSIREFLKAILQPETRRRIRKYVRMLRLDL